MTCTRETHSLDAVLTICGRTVETWVTLIAGSAMSCGSTPLMMAAMYGRSDVLKVLIEEGADASLRNEKGLTAIDFAQQVGRTANVEAIAAALRARQPRGSW